MRVSFWAALCCCCCYCYVTSVVSDSVRPHRQQPTRLLRPWDSPGKNTGVGCHFLLQCMKVKMKVKLLSHVRLFETPRTAAYQAPPSMGFFQARVLGWVAIAFSEDHRRCLSKFHVCVLIYCIGYYTVFLFDLFHSF